MAGEKMKKMAMESGMCSGCMCKTCGVVSGVLVIVAGAALLGFGLGNLTGMQAHIVAGGALGLYGVGLFVHAFGLCPMCKGT
jgi:hypothetical protein